MIVDTMKAYFDGMVVTSKEFVDHVRDLKWALRRMTFNNVQLISPKCAFDVNSEKFIGFVISQRGSSHSRESQRHQ